MTRRFSRLIRSGAAVILLALLAGCGSGDGLSDYERMKKKQESAADSIASAGGKATLKSYPQGDAWLVELKGATINDAVLDDLKSLGRISEMNLSKSTVTDAHLDRINEMGKVLLKLDLSHTAVTDAGFEKLNSLFVLSQLDLTGTKVSAAAVNQFLQKRAEDTRLLPIFKRPSIRR